MTVYRTKELRGDGEQSYYWVEYRLERGDVAEYRCRRQEVSDGSGVRRVVEETRVALWKTDDPAIPGWLRKYL